MVGGAYCTPFAYLIYHSKYITHTNIVDSGYIYVACIIQNIKISNIKKINKKSQDMATSVPYRQYI